MNFKMWAKALRVIPRVSKSEWQELDWVSQWLIATRSAIFVLTAYSVLVGGILAATDGKFDLLKFVLCFIGLVAAHATNNLLNDVTDSVRGVDKGNYFRTLYGPQVFEQGLWSKRTMFVAIILTGAVALSCAAGLAYLWKDNPQALSSIGILTAIGAFFVLFYTWPLKWIGLGEVSLQLVWGPLIVGSTYLALTGKWSWAVAWIGFAYGLSVSSVLVAKHTDKLEEDKAKHIHTLPVIIGEPLARALVVIMLLAQPILVGVFIYIGILGWPMLIVLLSLPRILSLIKVLMYERPREKPKDFPAQFWPTYLAGNAFRASRVTGGLFVLGLILDLFF